VSGHGWLRTEVRTLRFVADGSGGTAAGTHWTGSTGDAGNMSENPQCVRKYDMKKVLGLRLTSGCDGYH
jgi:hypothetical protein